MITSWAHASFTLPASVWKKQTKSHFFQVLHSTLSSRISIPRCTDSWWPCLPHLCLRRLNSLWLPAVWSCSWVQNRFFFGHLWPLFFSGKHSALYSLSNYIYQLSIDRVAGFAKRFTGTAMQLPPHAALALLACLHVAIRVIPFSALLFPFTLACTPIWCLLDLLEWICLIEVVMCCLTVTIIIQRHPKVQMLLDREQVGVGVHLPYLDEPEHSNAFASTMWELSLLKVFPSQASCCDITSFYLISPFMVNCLKWLGSVSSTPALLIIIISLIFHNNY